MKTITLNIEDNIFDEFINLNTSRYENRIKMIGDDSFTEDDEIAYNEASDELAKGETIGHVELKAILNV